MARGDIDALIIMRRVRHRLEASRGAIIIASSISEQRRNDNEGIGALGVAKIVKRLASAGRSPYKTLHLIVIVIFISVLR